MFRCLIEMLGSRYERERIAAADVLGKLEARAAASAVTRTMEDESRAVRVAAIVAAGKIRTPEAVDRLVEVIRAGHEKGERPQAVIALGLIGDERAVPAVIRALDDRRLRGWAIEALGRIAGSDAEAAIRHAQIPAWHRWDHLRRRQALTRIAQRTGVGSPLVSALAERVAPRAAGSLLGGDIFIGVAAGLRDARVWPSLAVAAAITGVYAAHARLPGSRTGNGVNGGASTTSSSTTRTTATSSPPDRDHSATSRRYASSARRTDSSSAPAGSLKRRCVSDLRSQRRSVVSKSARIAGAGPGLARAAGADLVAPRLAQGASAAIAP